MKRPAAILLAAGVVAAPAWAAKKGPVPPPPLVSQHAHASGAFSFRTPSGWTAAPVAGRPEAMEAWGGPLGVRFVYQPGEAGLDSLHSNCMLERLAGPMETEPQVKYEYDFVGGPFGVARALDSAFVVKYDNPIQGHRAWRQRTLTVVGAGHSLCLASYVPVDLWKRSPEARATTEAVMASVTLNVRP